VVIASSLEDYNGKPRVIPALSAPSTDARPPFADSRVTHSEGSLTVPVSEVIRMAKTKEMKRRESLQHRLSGILTGATFIGLGIHLLNLSSHGTPMGMAMGMDVLWRYWPLFMITAGLPALLLPTGDGNQALGLVVTGVGVFFELQTLGLMTWSFQQAWPILLIVVGAMLLLKSWRSIDGNGTTDDNGTTGGGQ
jgi:Domain of unknown function (DUF5668)